MTDALFDTDSAVGVARNAPTADTTPAAANALGAAAGEDGRANATGEGAAARPILDIHVIGVPAPQGSKKGFVNPRTGRAIIVDDNKPRLRTWRQDVKEAAAGAAELLTLPAAWTPLVCAVELDITFLMPRPRGHYRTGRNAHLLRDGAPARPVTKPDVDKLLRATLDALTGLIYRDDSQVVTITGRKVYSVGHPGALISIYTGGRA